MKVPDITINLYFMPTSCRMILCLKVLALPHLFIFIVFTLQHRQAVSRAVQSQLTFPTQLKLREGNIYLLHYHPASSKPPDNLTIFATLTAWLRITAINYSPPP